MIGLAANPARCIADVAGGQLAVGYGNQVMKCGFRLAESRVRRMHLHGQNRLL
jgi:hypothetical protein